MFLVARCTGGDWQPTIWRSNLSDVDTRHGSANLILVRKRCEKIWIH